MRPLLFLLIFLTGLGRLSAQEVDPVLDSIRQRLDSIQAYTARIVLEEQIDFIDMPPREVVIRFKKGQTLQVKSDHFVLLPKRGLDLSLNELFKHPFITVRREPATLRGATFRVINLIPTDPSAGFSLATVYIEGQRTRIRAFEINTRDEGSYQVYLEYGDGPDMLPTEAEIRFRVDRLRIPLNFMGKDSQIDRRQLREEGPKEGSVLLKIHYDSVKFTGQ